MKKLKPRRNGTICRLDKKSTSVLFVLCNIAVRLVILSWLIQESSLGYAQSQNALPSVAIQGTNSDGREGQNWPRERLFVGGSYAMNVNYPPRVGAFGIATSASHSFIRYFGVEGVFARYFGHNTSVFSSYTTVEVPTPSGGIAVEVVPHYSPVVVRNTYFGLGPRVDYKSAFFHVLFGDLRQSAHENNILVNAGTASINQQLHASAFTMSIGGGYEWRVNRHWALRTSVDYLPSFISGFTSGVIVSSVAATVGPVFTFGNQTASRTAVDARAPVISRSAMTIPALGVLVATRTDVGAEIAQISPGSAAQDAGLRVGDIVNSVDGVAVQTATDLAANLATKASGSKVKIGYKTREYWQTETIIILPNEVVQSH